MRKKVPLAVKMEALKLLQSGMSDSDRLAYWQNRYIQYSKAARKSPVRANAKFIAATLDQLQKPNDKFYSTLRGFIIASLSAQLKTNE